MENNKTIFLRISYWTAAIADFIIAILVLIPERMGLSEIVYPMGLISVASLSWAILLIFADQKPIERSWVLLPTIIVIALLSVVRVIFAIKGTVNFSLPFLILAGVLIALMIYSLMIARKLKDTQ